MQLRKTILAGAALGPRFGLLLGLCAMAVSAVVTGGIGPWLPFQMLALSWMGAGAVLPPSASWVVTHSHGAPPVFASRARTVLVIGTCCVAARHHNHSGSRPSERRTRWRPKTPTSPQRTTAR